MASAFGHVAASIALTKASTLRPVSKRLWIFSIFSSIAPDLDSIGFKLGVPYDSMLGHRGLSHSLLFAFVWSGLSAILFFRNQGVRLRVFLIICLSMLSHGVLDAMTSGGLGVGFFMPFKMERYFFSIRPIQVSPISIAKFFAQSEKILANEALWIGLPCVFLVLMAAPIQNRLRKYF